MSHASKNASITPESALSRLKPCRPAFDRKALGADVLEALPHLAKAMDVLDGIYRRQQDEALPALWNKVMDGRDEEMKTFFRTFNGPWSTLDGHVSVMSGVADRRAGGSFYPEDITREEWEKALAGATPEEKERLQDCATVIRRDGQGLKTIAYHEHYAHELAEMRRHMNAAADCLKHPGLASFLRDRAKALCDGSYRDSDAAWVRLADAPLEVVIGPFEVYEDNFQGIKAAYEAMLMAVDQEKGQRLQTIAAHIGDMARVFPVPGGSKPSVGGLAPIVVVNQLYSAGEARSGVMASAFNLPNDPWVRAQVGWKQVMIVNVMRAKFETCTRAISSRVVEGGENVEFDPYFFFVLMHEVSHGLGPAYRENGEQVARSMGSFYTPLEEAKADTGGVFLLQRFAGQYGIPSFTEESLLRSYLAGLFRSMRFGLHEAHGAANVIQFNWYEEKGVIKRASGGRYRAEATHFRRATDELLDRLTNLQATGSMSEIEAFMKRYATPPKHVEEAIESLKDIPIDIRAEWSI
jgi:hypothetical protein